MLLPGIVAIANALLVSSVGYSAEVLADSPLAYWKLNEVAGTDANDSSGNGYDGTYTNGFTLAQSPLITVGNSVDFDGATGTGVQMDATADLRIAGDITMEAWVNIATLPQNSYLISCSGVGSDVSANNFLYGLAVNSTTGVIYVFTESGGGVNQTVSSTHTIATGELHHLVAVRDATAKTITFFDNGVEFDTVGYATNADGGTSSVVRIGDTGGAGELDGLIDQVALYDSKLSATRIRAHYDAGNPNFGDVSLLLTLDGADAATSTIDSSNYAHTITFNGTAQLDTAEFKNGISSALFSLGDFLTAPDDASFTLGNGDFTLETHIRFNALPSASAEQGHCMIAHYKNTNNQRSWFWSFANTNEIQFHWSANGVAVSNVITTNAPALSTDVWYHVAMCRDGSTVRIFFDGIQLTTSGASIGTTTLFDSTESLRIGTVDSSNGFRRFTDGWLDNIRITKGVARYTSDFVPPPNDPFVEAEAVELDPCVSLLLALDGTDGATSTTDASQFSHSITFNGNAQLDTAQSKFGTASVLLDGDGDFLSAPDDATFELGAEEWTIELHVRFNGDPGTADMAFVTKWEGAGGNSWFFGLRNNTFVGFHTINGTSAVANFSVAWNPVGETWYHIAICRDNSAGTDQLRVFIDGVLLGANSTVNGATFADVTSDVQIGAFHVVDGPPFDYLDGWIDNVRVTLGFARYVVPFTPPTEAYPSEGPADDIYFGSVSLLLALDGADAATSTTDESSNAHSITFNNNAQLDTAQAKFGASSALFDGTGDFLSVADDNSLDFGTGEWTVECHVRFNGDPGTADMSFVTKWTEGGNQRSWFFGIQNNALVGFNSQTGTDGFFLISQAFNPNGNQWYHIAFTRDNSATDTVRVFVDGVLLGSSASVDVFGLFFNSTADVQIGSSEPNAQDLDGWIDNVRITKGVARYTGENPFKPPTAPYFTSGPLPAGLESGAILDAQLSASTEFDGPRGAEFARLNNADGSHWAASTAMPDPADEWWKIDFGSIVEVAGISTQGGGGTANYITTYKLEYNDNNGGVWTPYNSDEILTGNENTSTIVNNSLIPFTCRYLRVRPQTWVSFINLRAEFFIR